MTKIQYVLELVEKYPDKSNAELEKLSEIEISTQTISTYIKRLQNRGKLNIVETEKGRLITVISNKEDNFKMDTFEMMIDKYLEDFEKATGFSERLEIGKMILKLLGKI